MAASSATVCDAAGGGEAGGVDVEAVGDGGLCVCGDEGEGGGGEEFLEHCLGPFGVVLCVRRCCRVLMVYI